ncbi:SAM-dependent DNA methyltransferase [Achromobacter sp. SD115]|nr:SAM-dependent DNA methyltransferase [Achromobacter sp. SD115]
MTSTEELASRLWSLCHVLRDDGIVYHKYLSELTYLIFLKNVKQLGVEKDIPVGCRWDDLLAARGPGMLGYYRKMLTRLGEDVEDANVRSIFSFPTTVFSHDENLEKVVAGIQAIDWHQFDKDGLGGIYEHLLERNASEARSGSGQYFTPRSLVNAMIMVLQPKAGEVILDPAAGTGGFLIAAHRAATARTARGRSYEGMEIERDTYRLCLMNFYLHGMQGTLIHGDALTEDSAALQPANVVLANPPFGVSAGGARKRRSDLPYPTANKQLAFLQCISLALAPGGRAAVVVPDNVLFEPGVGRSIRRDLIEHFDVHTLLRLPVGIFYAAGVRTHVMFFNKRRNHSTPPAHIWIYDLRSGVPNFTKRKTIQDGEFEGFIHAFGKDPYGTSPRTETDRFKKIPVAEIRARDYDLDVRWDSDDAEETAPDLADLLAQMDDSLCAARDALTDISAVVGSVQSAKGSNLTADE